MKNPKAIDLVTQAVPLVSGFLELIEFLRKNGVSSAKTQNCHTLCTSWLANAGQLIGRKKDGKQSAN